MAAPLAPDGTLEGVARDAPRASPVAPADVTHQPALDGLTALEEDRQRERDLLSARLREAAKAEDNDERCSTPKGLRRGPSKSYSGCNGS